MDVEALAGRLWAATCAGEATTPLTVDHPELTVEAAYDVQEALVARFLARGEARRAVKLGLTSPAKQRQMGVTEPLYGWLTSSMTLDVGEPLVVDDLIHPRAEPEIAFLLAEDLEGEAVTTADVLAATAAVAPAIDVLDSRFAGYSFTLADVTADDASAGRYLVGAALTPPGEVDLRTVGCVFTRNGEVVGTASGAATLGHPAAAVAWAARKLAARGARLEAGTWVLSGALTAAVPLASGDHVVCELDHLGSLTLRAV